MDAWRDEDGLLRGDLDYGGLWSWPVTVLSHISPILCVCPNCVAATFHVIGKQPTGPGIVIPLTKKVLASLTYAYYLICNECATVSRRIHKRDVAKLEASILPAEICDVLDAFYGLNPQWPQPYTAEFARAFVECDPEADEQLKAQCLALISAYNREKQ